MLKIRKKIGAYINPNSKVFDFEKTFLVMHIARIAYLISKSLANEYTIYTGDSRASPQNNFIIEMMQCYL